ncbi:MAG: hypothetical protein AAFO91_16755 [Bacteroidota bacterium]
MRTLDKAEQMILRKVLISKTSDYFQPPSPWDCDFESNTVCSWTVDNSLPGKWELNSGSTPTQHTGPPADHTLKTHLGHYVFFNAADLQEYNTAR